jgi:hypothetical protein
VFAGFLLQAVFEDLPLGLMNIYYLCMSLLECLGDGWQGNDIMHLSTCDLERVPTLVMLAGCLSSAASLGYKAAHLEVIQIKWEIQTALEKERAALIEEVTGMEAEAEPETGASPAGRSSKLKFASSSETSVVSASNLLLQPVALVDQCLSAS